MPALPHGKNHLSPFDLVILVLSVYVLAALLAQATMLLPPEVAGLLNIVDTVICVVFLADFFVRLYAADRKWAFLKWGWIDLVSSIPVVPALRVGRLFPVVRIFRALRALRSAKALAGFFFRFRSKSVLAAALLMAFVLAVAGSVAMLYLETAPNSNIKNEQDSLWWAVSTVTTVGYGDKFPVTLGGRVVAVVLMITGVALIGTFTACVATWFVGQEIEAIHGEERLERHDIDGIHARLDRIESMLAEMNKPRNREKEG